MNNLLKSWFNPRQAFLYLVIVLLIAGVFFRFVNLDQKVYTADEVRGIARMMGYRCNLLCDQLTVEEYGGKFSTTADLRKYQYPNPERNVGATIDALAGNPEHPPLYYLLGRFWIQLFNHPVGSRIFTVVISLFIFPCIYWLSQELFASSLVGWSAIAFVAISPYHLMLAQEARQYSLWTVAILLSGVTLLRSLRQPTVFNWVLYGSTVALGIYCHLFFLLVVVAYGIYVLLMERLRITKLGLSYLAASIAGIATFIPWVIVLILSRAEPEKTTDWVASFQTGLLNRVGIWLHNLSTLFVDFQLLPNLKNPLPYLVFILLIYAIYWLCKTTTPRVWLFIVLLLAIPALAHVIPDLLSGGRRSLLARYFVPSFVAINLAIAYLVVSQINRPDSLWWQKKAWQFLFAVILTLGLVSSAASAEARDWWKVSTSINIEIAEIINQSSKPLIISEAPHSYTLALSYLVKDDVTFQLFRGRDFDQLKNKLATPEVMANYSQVYVYLLSRQLRSELETERGYSLKPLVTKDDRTWLYSLTK